jgi:hypothetical protein
MQSRPSTVIAISPEITVTKQAPTDPPEGANRKISNTPLTVAFELT